MLMTTLFRWEMNDRLRSSVVMSALAMFANFLLSILMISGIEPVRLLQVFAFLAAYFMATIFLAVIAAAGITTVAVDFRNSKLMQRAAKCIQSKPFRVIGVYIIPISHIAIVICATLVLPGLFPDVEPMLMVRYIVIYHRAVCLAHTIVSGLVLAVSLFACVQALREYPASKAAPKHPGKQLQDNQEFRIRMYMVFNGCMFISCATLAASLSWDIALTFQFNENPAYAVFTWIILNFFPGYCCFFGIVLAHFAKSRKTWATRFLGFSSWNLAGEKTIQKSSNAVISKTAEVRV